MSEACNSSGWALPGARSPAAEQLQVYLTTIPLPSVESPSDNYFWLVNDVPFEKFTAKSTWEDMRQRASIKSWTSHVWFKGSVPRHSFLMWLVHLDRLPTRARLASWGLNTPTSCCLCDDFVECRDHLFLTCSWSQELWRLTLSRLGVTVAGFYTWTAFSVWLDIKDATTTRYLKRLVVLATIYCIWFERNKRLHDNISTSPRTIFKQLDRFIRDAILSKRNRRQYGTLMQEWLRYD